MSEEQFLARWSRRKQQAKADHAEAAPEKAAEALELMPSDRAAAEPIPPVTDLSSLPSIESIDAATDITAFLRKGIPQELSRAALRRAWSADPAIRDFVGLAENAWDINDPNAMPGFGPLDCSEAELGELVDRIIGGVRRAAERLPNPLAESRDDGPRTDSVDDTAPKSCSAEAIADLRSTEEPIVEESPQSLAAPQPEPAQGTGSDQTLIRRRTHGGALPR